PCANRTAIFIGTRIHAMCAAIGLSSDLAVGDQALLAVPPSTEILFVDLDGTLIATDILWESLLLAIKRDPQVVIKFAGWLRQGRAALKEQLALEDIPDAARLPYREEVLAFLREERAKGVKIVLATASHRSIAERVAAHLGLFDDVLATD